MPTETAEQNFNKELSASISTLQSKREALQRQISIEEAEAKDLKSTIEELTAKLKQLDESLARKTRTRDDYDKTIDEVTAAFNKIKESSETLLHVLKRETKALVKRQKEDVGEPRPNRDEAVAH